eukprot:4367464-Amphidinium_carterae.1
MHFHAPPRSPGAQTSNTRLFLPPALHALHPLTIDDSSPSFDASNQRSLLNSASALTNESLEHF